MYLPTHVASDMDLYKGICYLHMANAYKCFLMVSYEHSMGAIIFTRYTDMSMSLFTNGPDFLETLVPCISFIYEYIHGCSVHKLFCVFTPIL